MDKYFRTEDGKRVNIVEHTLEQLEKWPNLKVYVATDSQDSVEKSKGKKRRISRYATVIVYRYGNRGAHYVYYVEDVPKQRDMFVRLYEEAARTIEAAQLIDSEIPIAFEALEFDYNNIPNFNSNRLLASVRGWALGMNYKAAFKGDEMIAAKAADHICRHKRPVP